MSVRKNPLPCAGIFLRDSRSRILLVKSWKWGQGKIWSIPGGKVKWGETIEKALEREAHEELGVKVKFLRVFVVWDAIFPKDFFQKQHFIFLECECLLSPGERIKVDNQEIQEARWFNLGESLKQDLEDFSRRSITVLYKEAQKEAADKPGLDSR